MSPWWKRTLAWTAALVAGCAPSRPEAPPEPGPDEIVFVVEVPEGTPRPDPVYVAGDFQNWNPGDPKWRLLPLGEGRHAIRFQSPDYPIAFKFTRGTWEKVEKGASGQEIPNRELEPEVGETYQFRIENWADLGPEGPPAESTVTGDLEIREFARFLKGRKVRVWMPPGYRDGDERYPVLYMWDGQNMFDAATSFAGEWRMDETVTELIEAGKIPPIIVVGIDNGGVERLNEYTPWPGPRGGGGGEKHLELVIDYLKPVIDKEYRTLPGRESTSVGGSSLGGLMTIYAVYARPDVFSGGLAFSPYLEWDVSTVLARVQERSKPPVRLYADMGELESGRYLDTNGNGVADPFDRLRSFRDAALEQGFVEGEDLMTVEEEDGKHHESAWARRLPAALEFLYGTP